MVSFSSKYFSSDRLKLRSRCAIEWKSEEKYLKEDDTIVQIGQIKGYQRKDILKIIRKHEKIRRRQKLTTLIEIKQRRESPLLSFPPTNELK
jgi:hypothetical protein